MRFVMLLSLVASASFAQGRFDRFNSRTDQGRSHRGFEQSSGAFFEFAPASGAGMGAACACAAVTGAKGETLTFTRTGNATCSKQGLATTGINNGDLVVCTGNLPRVESSGGVLGLRVEGARTNETLRSQEINVVWATTVAGVAAPTITADFATAPDGTTTADRMQIPACPTAGVDASGVNQTSATIASPSSSSVYLKANSGTPSVSICMYGITTGTRACTQFALNTSTWTRAVVPNVTNTGGMNMEIACENRTGSYSGATNTGAADILVWGAQSEAGAYATSYIPTAAGSAARNAELASFPLVPSSVVSGSMAVSVELLTTATNGLLSATAAGAFRQSILTLGGSRAYVGGVSLVGPLAALASGGVRRAAMWWDATSTNLILNGTPTAGAAGTPAATDRLQIGNYDSTAGTNEPGIYTLICYDPASSRCR